VKLIWSAAASPGSPARQPRWGGRSATPLWIADHEKLKIQSVAIVGAYFAPAKGIPEDPVTGAAHCMLAPYWAKRLGKTSFRAFQASRRGGEITCRLVGDRVTLEGACVFYLEGAVEI
jgi:predicted PhzF superfamily epimerase YddE/YHI9